ncbi:MAG TPA: hypothetical protein VLS27_09655 [Gammaproteobacteria bacterium]|nr:hypothetical protein [Gammaproteobacteria bacterium]
MATKTIAADIDNMNLPPILEPEEAAGGDSPLQRGWFAPEIK